MLFREARFRYEGHQGVVRIVEDVFLQDVFVVRRRQALAQCLEGIFIGQGKERVFIVEPRIHALDAVDEAFRTAGKVGFAQGKFNAVQGACEEGPVDALRDEVCQGFTYDGQNLCLLVRVRAVDGNAPQGLEQAVLEIAGNVLAQAGVDEGFFERCCR